ncbi:MAG: hypothetical protein MJK11_16585, partial [Pseudomonadales bacterium]|nr:hypothetical protein [Pseudomonadales bacterium]NQZ50769.1 hypothetical protein [Moritella sp.]
FVKVKLNFIDQLYPDISMSSPVSVNGFPFIRNNKINDGRLNTIWSNIVAHNNSLIFDTKLNFSLEMYRLVAGHFKLNEINPPQGWTVSTSNDLINWTEVDRRVDIELPSIFGSYTDFHMSTNVDERYYKFVFNSPSGKNIGLSRLQLFSRQSLGNKIDTTK